MVANYQKFYTDYKNKLFSYLLYRSGNRDIANDIMQESFTRHFKHYGQQSVISPTLLFTIARNALVDYQRDQAKFYRADFSAQSTIPDEESSFIVKEEFNHIHEAIKTLPEQDREILTLAVGGMAYKEIATIFNLSIANVKVKIHRSRKELRTILKAKV
jgi:RNA polymerase sigma-70 factor (ECF subfamily)